MSQQIQQHDMKKIFVDKVVVNIGVGKSGDPIEKAKKALLELTGQQPAVRGAKKTVRDFGIHKGEPIGAIVTMRRGTAVDFLKRVIAAKKNTLKASSFDNYGNISVGIHEHIDIPGTKYNPDIGIFGMDVNVVLIRPGFRIARKSRKSARIGKSHRISKEEAMEFFRQEFGAGVE
ncbi:MAG TPA: 50S ribosomal protein L5 [Nitrososphaera sp.]|jgi:large subunit ribosomal protein L5|nr:50S ribosomal protein L5 [Nitrososphaera sp.]